jgi:hypothetical protein
MNGNRSLIIQKHAKSNRVGFSVYLRSRQTIVLPVNIKTTKARYDRIIALKRKFESADKIEIKLLLCRVLFTCGNWDSYMFALVV